MSIFSKYKDSMLDFIEDDNKYTLRYPLTKTGNLLNNYNKGDFIAVGGRKTSGKSSFILNNYVISPLIQHLEAKKAGNDVDLKIIYINTRRTIKSTMEKMVVNYVSQRNGGNKIGLPSLYRYEGNHIRLSLDKSKAIMGSTMNTFDKLVENGTLNVEGGNKTLYQLDDFISRSLEEYGEFDEELGEFVYNDTHKDLMTIVAIDDVTGILSENGGSNFKNDNAHQLAIRLKAIAKTYNILLVLAVPSTQVFSRSKGHRSTTEEIVPYNLYVDRALILHNPLETEEKSMLGYEVASFINTTTGSCYLRTLFVASNYLGPSGIYLGYFFYPENGVFKELPGAEDEDELFDFYDLASK